MADVSALPDSMQAIRISSYGPPEVLTLADAPVPRPGVGEVLIRVAAAGVNHADLLQRQGHYTPPPGASPVLGLEVAGVIVALGQGVTNCWVDEAVTALVTGGGYAEYCVAPAVQCLPVPSGLTMVEAAALPETVFTVWYNLFERGRLIAGESVLIHGGASGIGTTAIQLAAARGCTVYVTAGTDEKRRACEVLGAAQAINYRTQDFVAVIKDLTGNQGVNVVLDMVGGDTVARNLDCLALEGRHISLAVQEGAMASVNLLTIMAKRLSLTGSMLRPRSVADKGSIAAAVRREVWPLVETGRMRPVIHAALPLKEAAAAHALLEHSAHTGKVVLTTRFLDADTEG